MEPAAAKEKEGVLEVFKLQPYSENVAWRRVHFREIVAKLTRYHYDRCAYYRNILMGLNVDPTVAADLTEFPFLPTGLFKRLDLTSVPPSKVCQVLISSGTSQSARSTVFLDRETSTLQMRALANIVTHFIGADRLPLMIVDAPRQPNDDRDGYAARSVALRGFSLFGTRRKIFALTQNMEPDMDGIKEFLDEVGGRRFLLFGFTYVIWQYLFKHLDRNDIRLNLDAAILIHGGGWKRLAKHNVSEREFRTLARELTGLRRIYNYYGMVEQPGSIYMQCERGFLHCSNFSEIFIRRPGDLSIADCGEPGIIQTISILPKSYPGHNLLTEDMGVMHGEDNCGCGRRGKYFEVVGRLPSVEPKGCGDTYLAAG